mgnify:FL=1
MTDMEMVVAEDEAPMGLQEVGRVNLQHQLVKYRAKG